MGAPSLEGSALKEPGQSALSLLFLQPTAPDQSLPQTFQEGGSSRGWFPHSGTEPNCPEFLPTKE